MVFIGFYWFSLSELTVAQPPCLLQAGRHQLIEVRALLTLRSASGINALLTLSALMRSARFY